MNFSNFSATIQEPVTPSAVGPVTPSAVGPVTPSAVGPTVTVVPDVPLTPSVPPDPQGTQSSPGTGEPVVSSPTVENKPPTTLGNTVSSVGKKSDFGLNFESLFKKYKWVIAIVILLAILWILKIKKVM
jgi:hypothetical protein